MAKKAQKKENLPMEEMLWKACDALRGSIEPSEYKYVVLSLMFLKYAGFHFEKRRREIITDGLEDFVDNVEFYAAKNVFYLPEKSRWSYLKENAKQPDVASKVDKALSDIEKENKPLRGALPNNYYSSLGIEAEKLGSLIESLRKINKQKGVDFTKRLEDIVKRYNDRSDDAALANDVIDDVVGEMVKLMEEVAGERCAGEAIGLSLAEKAFFDILKAVAVKYDFVANFPDEKLTELAKAIKAMVEEQSDVEDWLNRTDLRATLKMNIIVLLARAGYPPKIRDEVFKEILEQAENFKRNSMSRPYATCSDDSMLIAAEP